MKSQKLPADFLDPQQLEGLGIFCETRLEELCDREKIPPESLARTQLGHPSSAEEAASAARTILGVLNSDVCKDADGESLTQRHCAAVWEIGCLHLSAWLAEGFEVQVYTYVAGEKPIEAVDWFSRLLGDLGCSALELNQLAGGLLKVLPEPKSLQRLQDEFWLSFRSGMGVEEENSELLSRLAYALTEYVDHRTSRYRVRVLLVDMKRDRGVVEDLWFAVHPASSLEGHEEDRVRRPSWMADGNFYQALKEGFDAARICARELGLDTRFDVIPLLRPRWYVGESIGLAAAIGILARALDRHVNPEVAITGKLSGQKIEPVDRNSIIHKLQAASREGLKAVVIPAANISHVPEDLKQLAVPARCLRNVIHPTEQTEPILIDMWETYLDALQRDHREIPFSEQLQLFLGKARPGVVVCPYARDPDALSRYLNALSALIGRNRLKDMTAMWPIPLRIGVQLHLNGVQNPTLRDLVSRLEALTTEHGIPGWLLLHQLRGGAVLLVEGADALSHQDLKRQVRALLQTARDNSVVFAGTERTREQLRAILEGSGDPVPELWVLNGDGRGGTRSASTFLGDQERRLDELARSLIWPCAFEEVSVEAFFRYLPEREESGRLRFRYDPTPVRRNDVVQPSLAELVNAIARSPGRRRILLLGEGGTGKTVSLLHLAFESLKGSGPLNDMEFVPCYVRLSSIFPDRRGDFDALYNRLVSVLDHPRDAAFLETDLRWTPRILLLLDGLDEIALPLERRQQAMAEIGSSLSHLVTHLHPTSVTVLATRLPERRYAADALSGFDPLPGCFERWEEQELSSDPDDIRKYLVSVGHSPEEAKQFVKLLGDSLDVLTVPAARYLLARQTIEDITNRRGQRPIGLALLYRLAVEDWFEKEQSKLEAGVRDFMNEHLRGATTEESLIRAVGRIARQMLDSGTDILRDELLEEAIGLGGPTDEMSSPTDVDPRSVEALRNSLKRLPMFRALPHERA